MRSADLSRYSPAQKHMVQPPPSFRGLGLAAWSAVDIASDLHLADLGVLKTVLGCDGFQRGVAWDFRRGSLWVEVVYSFCCRDRD